MFESPIQLILRLEIDVFFISSIVKISDNICAGWESGLRPFIKGIFKFFLKSSNFF